jgi:hypothetical protein
MGILTTAYAIDKESLSILQQSTKHAERILSALGEEARHSLDKSWEDLLRILAGTGYDDVRVELETAISLPRDPRRWLRYLPAESVSSLGVRLTGVRTEDLLRRIDRLRLTDAEGRSFSAAAAEYAVSHAIGLGQFLARVTGRSIVLATG